MVWMGRQHSLASARVTVSPLFELVSHYQDLSKPGNAFHSIGDTCSVESDSYFSDSPSPSHEVVKIVHNAKFK